MRDPEDKSRRSEVRPPQSIHRILRNNEMRGDPKAFTIPRAACGDRANTVGNRAKQSMRLRNAPITLAGKFKVDPDGEP